MIYKMTFVLKISYRKSHKPNCKGGFKGDVYVYTDISQLDHTSGTGTLCLQMLVWGKADISYLQKKKKKIVEKGIRNIPDQC